ncbi:MAG: DUF2232 domain-containing protein [Gloeomargarita sp. GMQP_bins_120]
MSPPQARPALPLALVETSFLASTASLAWLASFYLGLTPVLRLFLPIPLALATRRWGHRWGWLGLITTFLLLSVLMGPPRGLAYVLRYGFLAVMLGYHWRRGTGWGMTILQAIGVGTVGFFAQIGVLSVLVGEDLWLYISNQATGALEWLFDRLGILWQPTVLAIQIATVMLVMINAAVYTFVVQLVAWALLERLDAPVPPPPTWLRSWLGLEEW